MNTTKRILVCGGREYSDKKNVFEVLSKVVNKEDIIVHGGASGADTLTGEYGKEHGIKTEVHYAKWAEYGKMAGPIRNTEMLNSGINIVVAFKGGKGTANMVRKAKKENVKVIEIE